MDRFDDQYVTALRSLSIALMVVAKLAERGPQGRDFNNEVLAKRLGSCWGKSIDEMASQIHEVADAMEGIRKQIDVWDSLIEENQCDWAKGER